MRTAAVLAALLLAAPSLLGDDTPTAGAKQLILVVSSDWDSTAATLRRYERKGADWSQSGDAVDVVIGRSGLAWGAGVNRDAGPGPVKREGDGKSPAGVFHIGHAFGFESAPGWMRLPYIQLRDSTQCVDDPASQLYNQIVLPAPMTKPDWSSSEKMRAIDVYRWGAVVLHNDPPQKGRGSCIFLHLVDPHGKPTSGCTSMAAAALEALLRWIDPAAQPLLVQLPRAEYDRLRSLWQLP
jgi:D-alanyl-D-alanine dipeptidase